MRYADDFLIGVIGTKNECERIKADITKFMQEKLRLEMSALIVSHSFFVPITPIRKSSA